MSEKKIVIVIVAAMEREVSPLIRNWKSRTLEHDGWQYRLFENREAALICGGIGAEAARRATEAVIREVNPARVISVGFAGALPSANGSVSLRVGDILEPRTVINVADGVRTEIEMRSGQGILVSFAAVADKEQKIRLSTAYGASAVDMEAAAVAQAAQARGIEFAAIKAISDDADFSMPQMDKFISGDGQFRSAAFAFHVAVRPWLWGRAIALGRNSAKASQALSAAVAVYLMRETIAAEPNLSGALKGT